MLVFSARLKNLTKKMKKKKLLSKDKQLHNWLKAGGREGAKEDFLKVITQASKHNSASTTPLIDFRQHLP